MIYTEYADSYAIQKILYNLVLLQKFFDIRMNHIVKEYAELDPNENPFTSDKYKEIYSNYGAITYMINNLEDLLFSSYGTMRTKEFSELHKFTYPSCRDDINSKNWEHDPASVDIYTKI